MTGAQGLSVVDVVRTFDKGRFVAVDHVSLNVSPGRIVAVLGPNGAGKTTLVRMCSTLLTPDSGTVMVGGVDAVRHPQQARRGLGVMMGGELGFYMRATVEDNLLFFADVAGLGRDRRTQVRWALDRVGLANRSTAKVAALSRGMKQRLHLARAILGGPSVLLLDEPTSGLDPEIASDIRALIRDIALSGTAVLMTSHTLSEVEALADSITVIGAGRVAVEGKVADVARAAGVDSVSAFTVSVLTVGLREQIMECRPVSIDAVPSDGEVRVRVMWPKDEGVSWGEAMVGILEEHGEVPPDFVQRPPTLEEAYLGLASRLVRA